jgi:hypothetical protein
MPSPGATPMAARPRAHAARLAVNVQIQVLILAKGRTGYEMELMGDLAAAASDKALFKRIYSSWRPT